MRLKKFDYHSLGHAAQEANVSQSSMYQWARAGKIETLRASDGSYLIPRRGLQQAKALAKKTRDRLVG